MHGRDRASVRRVRGAEQLIPRTVAGAVGLAVAVGADVGDGRVIQVGPEGADEGVGEGGADDRVLSGRRGVRVSRCQREGRARRSGYLQAARC